MKSRYFTTIMLALLVAGFGMGVVWLFKLRFDSGDIYPPYSSLRADPLGTKALFESLQDLPGFSVRRFFEENGKLKGNPQRTFFFFGVEKSSVTAMSMEDFRELDACLFAGGRVVVSLRPAAAANEHRWGEKSVAHAKNSKPSATNDLPEEQMISWPEKIGARMATDPDFIPRDVGYFAHWSGGSPPPDGLPESTSWHSGIYFAGLDKAWRALYKRDGYPVIIERPFGKGSLVLAGDSYLVSNEALRNERYPGLLSWLLGGRREIIFDETHLGVQESPGIAGLLRQYHLEGLLVGLLFVAGLFVWRSGAPLVPPYADEPKEAAAVRGREAAAGFASLLRRSIPASEILFACFAEWQTAFARNARAASRMAAIRQIIDSEQSKSAPARQPLEAWRAVQHVLTERK